MLLRAPDVEKPSNPRAQLAITYRFDRFVLDVPKRVLYIEGEAKPLSEKVFRVLLVLLEAEGGVVGKEHFFEKVWPSESASEQNLTQHICMLRNILRNGGRERSLILSVPGRGYRFGAIVERKVGLIMKAACERCNASLEPSGAAFICSYECTFCANCSEAMSRRCPNCGGELAPRPRRMAAEA